MFIKIGAALSFFIAAFLAYVAILPAEYVVTRELSMKASPEKIFPYLNNSKMADSWAPWAESDPQMKMSYSGSAEGIGSISTWDSPGQMGSGRATIVESLPNQKVAFKLETFKPMAMEQNAEYSIRTNGEESVVTWKVEGHYNFIGRLMCVFINMDKMVGGMFEKGLANLKILVEKN